MIDNLEDQIERWVERMVDQLDRRYMTTDLSQEDYESEMKKICIHGEELYKKAVSHEF